MAIVNHTKWTYIIGLSKNRVCKAAAHHSSEGEVTGETEPPTEPEHEIYTQTQSFRVRAFVGHRSYQLSTYQLTNMYLTKKSATIQNIPLRGQHREAMFSCSVSLLKHETNAQIPNTLWTLAYNATTTTHWNEPLAMHKKWEQNNLILFVAINHTMQAFQYSPFRHHISEQD